MAPKITGEPDATEVLGHGEQGTGGPRFLALALMRQGPAAGETKHQALCLL